MTRIGVKCEIHTCSIEFMKECLKEFYDLNDFKNLGISFSARTDLQYFSDRPVDQKIIDDSKKNCKLFFIKTKNILSVIREEQILAVRKKLMAKSK